MNYLHSLNLTEAILELVKRGKERERETQSLNCEKESFVNIYKFYSCQLKQLAFESEGRKGAKRGWRERETERIF